MGRLLARAAARLRFDILLIPHAGSTPARQHLHAAIGQGLLVTGVAHSLGAVLAEREQAR